MKKNHMTKSAAFAAIFLAVLLSAGMLFAGCATNADEPLQEVTEPEEPEPPEIEEPEPLPEPEPALTDLELLLGTLAIGFGFTDEDGFRLLHSRPVKSVDAGDEDAGDPENADDETNTGDAGAAENDADDFIGNDPKEYTLAIGPYGQLMLITYSAWQNETGENNHRDRAGNFENLPGYVYRTENKLLISDKTYVLTTAGPLVDTNTVLNAPGGRRGNTPAMEEDTIEYLRGYKDRNIEWGKTLATTRDGVTLGVVLYERLDDDMLFSIVYMDENRVLFWDCPAVYDETYTWRADCGAEPGTFGPLFLARFNEGLALAFTWAAPGDETILFLYEKDGAFVQWEDAYYRRIWR